MEITKNEGDCSFPLRNSQSLWKDSLHSYKSPEGKNTHVIEFRINILRQAQGRQKFMEQKEGQKLLFTFTFRVNYQL